MKKLPRNKPLRGGFCSFNGLLLANSPVFCYVFSEVIQMNVVNTSIKDLRKKKNMTQDELAEKLNVTRQAVSNWENGKTQPDIETLTQLAEVFEVSVERIIYGKEKSRWYVTFNPQTTAANTAQGCVNMGAIIAAVISFAKWQSIGWAILHGTLGWIYVLYYIIKY